MSAHQELGRDGEAAVAEGYERRGAVVVDRNWRCPAGELDLVVVDGRCVVFCEVKTRSSTRYGSPFDAVNPQKRRRLRRLAGEWLRAHDIVAPRIRIDVAAVLVGPDGFEIDVVADAC